MKNSKTLVVMRGVPGSGKSWLTEYFVDLANRMELTVSIHSTDSFFMDKGEYKFDPKNLGSYHQANLLCAENSMDGNIDRVIIDNTNTTFKEFSPYITAAKQHDYNVLIVEPETRWKYNVEECFKRNSHGVPKEAIKRMLGRFASRPNIVEQMNTAGYSLQYSNMNEDYFKIMKV